MSAAKPPVSTYFTNQLWSGNQILVAVLGICSALGVTNRLSVAITMGLSVSFVTAFSSFFVSLLRKITPGQRPDDHSACHHFRLRHHHRPVSSGLFFQHFESLERLCRIDHHQLHCHGAHRRDGQKCRALPPFSMAWEQAWDMPSSCLSLPLSGNFSDSDNCSAIK